MNIPFGYLILFPIMGLATAAFWHKMKVWSLTVQGFNLLFATLFAIGLFQPVANMLDGAVPMLAYYNDMLSFMLLFLIILAILMFATSMMTKSDLYFSKKTDAISKWIVFVVVFLTFYGTGCFVFYATLPEKPTTQAPKTMFALDFVAKGALKPMIGSTVFDTKTFVMNQYNRNAAVYTQVVEDEGNWKFDGDSSPNAQ